MYIYNLTFVIDNQLHNQWLEWFEKEYLPSLKTSKLVSQVRVFKVLTTQPEPTYAIHHQTESPQQLLSFTQEDIPRVQSRCFQLFGDKVLTFGTQLKEVSLK
ncbi:DUF4286 family protein [Capnocytophaga sp.]|uniref:DUF4286 family protein n=1 Tax=Capnocytophaga sp. TaxID=44737 RepID=UPI0026DCCC87|nr:DUF4286 family protein [Capnocytophaga sp.]MDO5104401.1 DUF4286 family protein [Capnocytophaga sp.]